MVIVCDASTNQLKVKVLPRAAVDRLEITRAAVMTNPSKMVAHSSQEFSFRMASQMRYVWKTPVTCASDTRDQDSGFRVQGPVQKG